MKTTLLTITSLLLSSSMFAQTPGDLDTDFGTGGYTLTDPYANTGEFYWDLITLSDDKIVKVGYTDDGVDTDILVSKFQANGQPDSTFGVNGFTSIDLSLGGDEDARGITALPSGQLLITGYVQTPGTLDAYVMRLDEDGTVDASFGTSNGHTLINTGDNLIAYGKSVISDGSTIFVGGAVLVGGQSDVFVCKLTQGGGIDNSFSTSGFATKDIEGGNDQLMQMDMKANGSFVMGGFADSSGVQIGFVTDFTQFGTPTGNATYHFNQAGGPNEINDLYVNANDEVVFVGDAGVFPNVNGYIGKLTSTLSLDATFGANGIAMSDPGATTALFLRGVVETPEGDILATGNFAGASNEVYAYLLDSTGSSNSNFGGNGDAIISFSIATNEVNAFGCALQSDGKIIIGGHLESQDFVGSNMFMVRVHPYQDNSSVFELEKETITVYPNPVVSEFRIDGAITSVALIDGNGRILMNWETQEAYILPSSISSGVYTVRVQTEQSIGLARIIVK
ncbi:MAG: hypothetical protein Crog4KO_20870 [Crocinitomicaceae bacterium]